MESQLNQNPEIVVALDLGTSKVCALVGRKNILGKIEILGYGKVNSDGVIRGVVSNIDKTAKAISDAIDMAEKTSKQELQVVHVGIAGQHIKSIMHQGVLYRADNQLEITASDVEKLIQDMYKIALPPGDQILHVIPQEFIVDDQDGIIDPVGMYGSRLQSNFHIITGNIAASNNIQRCLEKAGLVAGSVTLGSLASAKSVLSKEEIKEGVVLVDIGGGTTEVTIYHEGILRYSSVIPLGGNVITKDIKMGCSVTLEQAEKLKVRFGSALSEEIVDNRIITIQGLMGREPKEISEKNLARIIQARAQEIFDYVMWDISRSNFEKDITIGLVLTGGTSMLKNIDLLAEYQTGYSVRIGQPATNLLSHYEDAISNPAFATSLGLLIEGIEITSKHLPEKQQPKPHIMNVDEYTDEINMEVETALPARKSWIGSAVDKSFKQVRGFFEHSPDSEF
ncbi:MAG: cell division protein FtsA [Bacteroidota bacterium]|nr:cell division protein FtsA [Bacteroidota bacterium]